MTAAASTDLDVAIIGGGVSGVYCGWRIRAASPDTKVALFEYGRRIGGRLYTATMPGAPDVPCELGGMRIIKTDNANSFVESVVKQMQLATAPFPMGNSNPAIGESLNRVFLRDTHLLMKDLSVSELVPYNVAWGELNKNPDQLQSYVMNYLIPNNKDLTPQDWFDVEVFGEKLYKFGYWNLLSRVLSSEAYAFMRDACGYEANVANANAVLQLPCGDYTSETKYIKLVDGYQALPLKLAETYVELGGELNINHRLAEIEPAANSESQRRYKLTFVPTETDLYDRTFDLLDADPVVVYADKVILAMPRRSIELIEWRPLQTPEVDRLIKSVLIQEAFKLFLAYDRPWWKALNLEHGRAITDLPVRQVYYFGIQGENAPQSPADIAQNSIVMAAYCDIGSVPFWQGLQSIDPERRFGGLQAKARAFAVKHGLLRAAVENIGLPHGATPQMVAEAQNQVAEVHGLQELPEPYAAIYHEWAGDPYGGGWHEWKAGYEYFDVMKKIRKPVDTEDVFICGEAYSNNQGWVEGALQTAEHVLNDYFGLARPSWAPADIGP